MVMCILLFFVSAEINKSVFLARLQFCAGDGAHIHLVPEVGNVGHYQRDDERYDGHTGQGEFAGRTVAQGERTLQVGRRRIVSGVVVAG